VLPNVPTLAEAGVKDAEIYSWQGMAAPKGLPAALRDKIAAAAIAAVKDPTVSKNFTDQGMEVVANTPPRWRRSRRRSSRAGKR
jgi:tripartite-type tricarboxylate transporter receptor subunit TctC